MTVSAEPDSGLMRVLVALIAEILIVGMPRSMSAQLVASDVNRRICPEDAVKVGVTTDSRASRIGRIVTRYAIFDISLSRRTVLRPPAQQ